jgi:hypothetical protein
MLGQANELGKETLRFPKSRRQTDERDWATASLPPAAEEKRDLSA